jgi:hypothetical protein
MIGATLNLKRKKALMTTNEIDPKDKLIEWAKHALEWFEEYDTIHVNSKAYAELVRIMDEIKDDERD